MEASGELGIEKLTVITWGLRKELELEGRRIRILPVEEWV
ncbi:hypothetical protein PYCH_18070 [Pyrococcus yayanosii CH1]|uniref:Uncharacterized protein n=1 Tax=Pyrococcus yayanosii (strain CH1 / JCM 16557) TaxID=529709 RepID=F8AI07_PYRYC|nr:hypothetical protein PYCH_18070 [Pyrococcus yayanosii CH1]